MAIDLVTGGCGFIGRHLVGALLVAGREVRVLDCAEPRGLPLSVDYRHGSILDPACLSDAMRGVARVYHLAGRAHLWAADKQDFARVNVEGTRRVLEAAGDARSVVHCSTETVLVPASEKDGPSGGDSRPSPEQMPGPYTRSKYMAEQAALAAAQAGHHVVVASPTIPIGMYDWNATPPTAMLFRFLNGRAPAFIDCTLNLVDVRDVAEGIRLAGERGRPGQRYVLSGENLTLRQLLLRLERLSGRPMPSLALPDGVAMIVAALAEWIADTISRTAPVATREGVRLARRPAPVDDAKARLELGYRARPIDDALAMAVAWLARQAHQRDDPLLAERTIR